MEANPRSPRMVKGETQYYYNTTIDLELENIKLFLDLELERRGSTKQKKILEMDLGANPRSPRIVRGDMI